MMRLEPNRVRNDKYIKTDYERVENVSKKILNFISIKEREEMTVLMQKFNNHDAIFQQLLEQRFVLKKPFKAI